MEAITILLKEEGERDENNRKIRLYISRQNPEKEKTTKEITKDFIKNNRDLFKTP